MIRFGGRLAGGRRLIGLAIGPENIEHLKAGHPMAVDGNTVGADDVVVVVVYGETPEKAMEEMKNASEQAGASVSSMDDELETLRKGKH